MSLDRDDRRALRAAARDLLDRWSSSEAVRATEDGDRRIDPQAWRRIAEAGWTGLLVDEEHGGAGAGLSAAVEVLQESGAHTTPGPYLSTGVLFPAVVGAAVTPVVADLLSRIAEGTAVGAVAVGIGGGRLRGDTWSVTAEAAGDGVRLTGRARLVLDAPVADVFAVFARGSDGLVLALVDATATRVEEFPSIDRSRLLGDVELDSVEVAADAVLARGDAAGELLDRLVDVGTVAFAADGIGAASRAQDMSVEYAKQREQFGRPIGSFQAIKHKLADMYVIVAAGQAAVEKAAEAWDADAGAARIAVASVGTYCRKGASKVVGDALQTHGGIGFTWEHDCHLLLKRAKFAEAYLSDGWAQRERLVDALVPVAG
jgi:alkylation response protein AidB-like acyl-CoA dehydrogenase